MDDSVDLTCEPRFREFGRKSVSLFLTAVHYDPASCEPPANEVTLTVASSSVPATVGGAIANKVREKLPLCIKCIGAVAVANAVFAIANAREFLSKDNIVRSRHARARALLFSRPRAVHLLHAGAD